MVGAEGGDVSGQYIDCGYDVARPTTGMAFQHMETSVGTCGHCVRDAGRAKAVGKKIGLRGIL